MKNIVMLLALVATTTAFSIESKSSLRYSETYTSNVEEEIRISVENAIKVKRKRPESVPASGHAPQVDDQRPVGIVGGDVADISQFPYQVALLTDPDKVLCGGSILNKRFILTAAHCLRGQEIGQLSIRAGSSTYSSGGQRVRVSGGSHYANFSSKTMRHDVAVLELKEPLEYNERVQPVKLVDAGTPPADGSNITVTGWGKTRATAGVSEVLRTARVAVVNHRQCSEAYAYKSFPEVTEDMLCAAAPGKDACHGDSGGPAVNAEGEQVGIVSWGKGCADPEYPGVYTSLADMDVRRFIDKCLRTL